MCQSALRGVAADAPIKVKLAALIFSVLGFLYNLKLGGTSVEHGWLHPSSANLRE